MRIGEGEQLEGFAGLLLQLVDSLGKGDLDAGAAQQLEVAIEATDIQAEPASDAFTPLRALLEKSNHPIEAGKALRGDRRRGRGAWRGAAFLGHTILEGVAGGLLSD